MNYRLKRFSRCLPAFIFCFCTFAARAQQPAAVFPDPPPQPDSLSAADRSAWCERLSGIAQTLAAEFDQKAQAATLASADSDQRLKTAKLDTLTPKSDLDSLARIAKRAKKVEKDALKLQKQAAKTVEFVEKTEKADSLGQRKSLMKCYRQVRELHNLLYPPPPEKPVADIIGTVGVVAPDSLSPTPPQVAAEVPKEKIPDTRKNKENTGPKFKAYDPGEDVMLRPPQRSCSLAVSTRDEFSGETYKETRREELFRFTNELMKKYLPAGQPHIACEAALSTGGSSINLHLTFSIRDNNARKTFGNLGKNSVAILKFIDGSTLSAANLRNDDGVLDPTGQVFSYRAQYSIDPAFLKKLKKTELDKIRVSWSTGYEDYEVQNIDLLMRQIKCLFD